MSMTYKNHHAFIIKASTLIQSSSRDDTHAACSCLLSFPKRIHVHDDDELPRGLVGVVDVDDALAGGLAQHVHLVAEHLLVHRLAHLDELGGEHAPRALLNHAPHPRVPAPGGQRGQRLQVD